MLAANLNLDSDAKSAPRRFRTRLHRSTWSILLLAAGKIEKM
jgi:hypothetical protein